MAKLVFGMNQSLDGYIAGVSGGPEVFTPGPRLFQHFIDVTRGIAGSLYGRRMYEVMRYWDEAQPEWGASERDFAAAWQKQPKWVVSRARTSVGPNATLVGDDLEAFVRRLKADIEGEIDVAGADLAGTLTDLGLIDEYRLYVHPIVLGGGNPFFARRRPPLRLIGNDVVGEGFVRLTYVPA